MTTFDAPALGDSDGRQVTLPEIVAALRAVAADRSPVHGIIAHSIGAVVTARALYEGLAAGARSASAHPSESTRNFEGAPARPGRPERRGEWGARG